MKRNIYKRCLRVFLKDGTKQTLEPGKKIEPEDILGIILESGKIVSLNIYSSTMFSRKPLGRYPRNMMRKDTAWKIKNGLEDTERLKKYCTGINVLQVLKNYEYLPSVGELTEIFDQSGELKKLNLTRKLLGLSIFKYHSWFWSSTVLDRESVWCVSSFSLCDCIGSDYVWGFSEILPFIDEGVILRRRND